MALLPVAAGVVLASGGAPDWRIMAHALAGAALVAAGASALNQWSEREVDARMRRTRHRPLPAGSLQPGEVLVQGIASAAGGVVYLAGALILGIGFLAYAIGFSLRRSTPRARGVLRASLVDLPALLTLWLLDGIPHR
jgi:protoheme IX farnesyltransferase